MRLANKFANFLFPETNYHRYKLARVAAFEKLEIIVRNCFKACLSFVMVSQLKY